MPMVELSEDEFVEIYRIRQLLEPEEGSLSRWDLACLQGPFGKLRKPVRFRQSHAAGAQGFWAFPPKTHCRGIL